MNRRVLLYDGGCISCSDIARVVRDSTAAQIEVISLRSEEAVALLSARFPNGWDHRPYYIEIGSTAHVFSGLGMAAVLLRRCGVKGSVRILRELLRRPKPSILPGRASGGIGRRRFLIDSARASIGLLAAAAGMAALPKSVLAYNACVEVYCVSDGLHCLLVTQCPDQCSMFSVFFCYDVNTEEFCDAVYQDLGTSCPC